MPSPIDVTRLGEIYSRTAAFYDGVVADRQAGPKLEALRRLNRQRGERVLEVGVGTAWAFARLVAESGPEDAYALDVAAGMLEVARQRLTEVDLPAPSREGVRVRRESIPPPVHRETHALALLLADARNLPFQDATFDCLLHTYTFEVLATPDIPPVLDDCLRVLKHGGRIAIVNFTDGEGADAAMTEDWKRRYQDDPEYFGGARPLMLQPMLEARGYVSVTRTYIGPEWPSEVLLAYRPSSGAHYPPSFENLA